MSISRQNLTAIIVTFKSENVIHDCIRSIDKEVKIIVVDNSNDLKFKENLEKKYSNVTCILSKKNLGMGAGNNLGIKNSSTDFVFILNPDVILQPNALEEIITSSRQIESYGIIAPMEINQKYPNYKLFNNSNFELGSIDPFKVLSVDGYAMILNLKKLGTKENFYYFDENFFMYLENDDLCKRLNKMNENIYVIPNSKVKHLGGHAVDDFYKDEIELSRNWHWIWSKFYFNKKHYGFTYAFMLGFPTFLSSILKFLFYLLTNKNFKKNIYEKRILGFLNALLGKKSHFRPKID